MSAVSASRAAGGGRGASFTVLLVALHVVKSDPSVWRFISEAAIGNHG
jgi:hypothetical protein